MMKHSGSIDGVEENARAAYQTEPGFVPRSDGSVIGIEIIIEEMGCALLFCTRC